MISVYSWKICYLFEFICWKLYVIYYFHDGSFIYQWALEGLRLDMGIWLVTEINEGNVQIFTGLSLILIGLQSLYIFYIAVG